MHCTTRDRSIPRSPFEDLTAPARSGRSSCDSRMRRARTRSTGIQARAWRSPFNFGASSFLPCRADGGNYTLPSTFGVTPNAQLHRYPEGRPDLDYCRVWSVNAAGNWDIPLGVAQPTVRGRGPRRAKKPRADFHQRDRMLLNHQVRPSCPWSGGRPERFAKASPNTKPTAPTTNTPCDRCNFSNSISVR